MTNLDPDSYTQIIRFQVPPGNQEAFVVELTDVVAASIATLTGFRSASFCASEDGSTVLNLAQWDSAEAYRAAMASDVAAGAGVGDVLERHGAHVAHSDAFRVVRALSG